MYIRCTFPPPSHTPTYQPTHPKQQQAVLDELIQLTLDRMMGHVPLPAIVRKITTPLDTSSSLPPPTPSSRLLRTLGTPASASDTEAAIGPEAPPPATVGELRDLLLAMFETYHHERAIYASGAGLMAESHYRLLKQRRAAQGRGIAVRAVEGSILPMQVGLVVPSVLKDGGGKEVLWVDGEGRAAVARQLQQPQQEQARAQPGSKRR